MVVGPSVVGITVGGTSIKMKCQTTGFQKVQTAIIPSGLR